MTQANTVFILTLSLIFLGYLIKRFDIISETEGRVLSKVLMHTTFPALMLLSMLRIKLEANLFLIPLISISLSCLMILIAWFWFVDLPNKLRGVLTMSVGSFNSGLFGFPVVEGIWGREGLVYAIMFDIGVTLTVFCIVYTIGVYFASKGEARVSTKIIFQKILRLIPFQAAIIGLTLNALNLQLPTLATDFLEILAKANKPIVLLLMGIYLNFSFDKHQMISVSKALTIRYTCGLMVAALFYFILPVPSLYRNILMICVILPVGLTLIPFSDEFNFDTKIAGALVNISLLISFMLLWLFVVGFKMV